MKVLLLLLQILLLLLNKSNNSPVIMTTKFLNKLPLDIRLLSHSVLEEKMELFLSNDAI